MKIEEAIKHCEEKIDLTPCGMEHRQLAEWLRELQKSRTRVRWIPVEEQLPKTEEGYAHVMVSMDDGFVYTTDYTDSDGFELWVDSGEVTAWMPLPEPYNPQKLVLR